MNDITALAQRMKAAAERATQGEWWHDVLETEGTHGDGDDCVEGYHSYAVYDHNNRSLLDMTNSTAACIQTEWDGDYLQSWDEVAQRNAEHITASCPANVLALVEALEKSQAQSSKWLEAYHKAVSVGARYEERIAELERANAAQDDHINQQQDRIDVLEKRNAELGKYAGEMERYCIAYMEWSSKTDWVQGDKRFDVVKPLGKHRADVLREYVNHLEREKDAIEAVALALRDDMRQARTLITRIPERCDCCYSEGEAAIFDGVVAEFREKLELACAIAGIKLQITD